MKKLFLSGCMLGLALSLSACGGGGGGGGGDGIGGGGGGSASSFPFTISGMVGDATSRSAPELTNADQTASALASPDSGMQDTLKSGYSLIYHLKVEPDGSVSLKDFFNEFVTTFKPGDMHFYTKNGVDFAAMMDTPQPITSENYQGSVTQKSVVWIGKLDYASFGYWAQIWDYQSVHGDGFRVDSGVIFAMPFLEGKRADYSGGNLNFTGVAAGIVEYYEFAENGEKSVAIPLLGTADLSIASATSGTLVLTFPNFYKFTGSVNTGATGLFNGNFTEAQKLGSTFLPADVDLPATPTYSHLNGMLYGSSPANPSEAAGTWFWKYDTEIGRVITYGAFGMRKK